MMPNLFPRMRYLLMKNLLKMGPKKQLIRQQVGKLNRLMMKNCIM
jgi:hypothetical protein